MLTAPPASDSARRVVGISRERPVMKMTNDNRDNRPRVSSIPPDAPPARPLEPPRDDERIQARRDDRNGVHNGISDDAYDGRTLADEPVGAVQPGRPGVGVRGVDPAVPVAGVDAIYHLAGFVSFRPEDGRKMYALHVEGTRALLGHVRETGAKPRIVLASTSGTIAVASDERVCTEADDYPITTVGR